MIPQDRLIKYATLFLKLGIDNVEKLLELNDFDKFNKAILNNQLEEYKHDLEEIRKEKKGVRVMDLCTFSMFCIISGTLLGLYAIYRMERESRKDKEH